MNTAIVDMVRWGGEKAADAASSNPYVAGGMVIAGILIGVGKWIHDRRKKRRAARSGAFRAAPARPLVSER